MTLKTQIPRFYDFTNTHIVHFKKVGVKIVEIDP